VALIEQLPVLERDILWMHMQLRKPQTDIARILGVSQPTVNYRYKRARERLDFLERLPVVTDDEVRQVLERLGARDQDITAMITYVKTSSQSEVARRMGTSQGAIRHWLGRALVNHLQADLSEDDTHKRVRTACAMLVSRPGILQEGAKNGDSVKNPRSERSLPSLPRHLGRLVEGERILLLEGVYAGLRGTLVQQAEGSLALSLELASQDILLMWPP
jgi:DNA-directed RNA polymerase specialized sigma24 family protein